MKLGWYSCSYTKKLILFAEILNEKEIGTDGKPKPIEIIKQSDQIKDEYDYFTKYKKFENIVFKYEFSFIVYINGV